MDEMEKRREAIGYLLDYLARAEPESLEKSVDALRDLEDLAHVSLLAAPRRSADTRGR